MTVSGYPPVPSDVDPNQENRMTETTPERRWNIRHFRPADMSEADAAAQAKAHLRDRIRDEGYVLDGDSVQLVGEPQAIVLSEDGSDYRTWTGAGEPDGWITEWSATATERHRDEEPVDGVPGEGGIVTVTVPPHIAAVGGGIRARHNLGGPVTVTAFGGRRPVGYLFATPVDDDVEYVELHAGATHLVITADPEETSQ